MGGAGLRCLLLGARSGKGGLITPETVDKESRHATNCGYADTRQIMDLSIREILFQQVDNLPAIDKRLQLCGGAKVSEETPALINISQADGCFKERIFSLLFLPKRILSVWFH